MSGFLNSGMGQLDPAFIMSLMASSRKDPFTRPMPGEGIVGPGGLGGQFAGPPRMDGQPQGPQQGMQEPQMPGMNTISTDFQDTQPGLPNLPDSFQGFGYGQFAPKENQGGMASIANGSQGQSMQGQNLRQQLIQDMMRQLMPQLAAGGISVPGGGGGMGGPGGMGGF